MCNGFHKNGGIEKMAEPIGEGAIYLFYCEYM